MKADDRTQIDRVSEWAFFLGRTDPELRLHGAVAKVDSEAGETDWTHVIAVYPLDSTGESDERSIIESRYVLVNAPSPDFAQEILATARDALARGLKASTSP